MLELYNKCLFFPKKKHKTAKKKKIGIRKSFISYKYKPCRSFEEKPIHYFCLD